MLRLLVGVEPGEVVHHEGAAAIPVSLLVVRAYASHTAAKPLGVEGRVARIVERHHGQLPLGGRRAAGRADLAVGPRPRRHPIDLVITVAQRGAQDVPLAFGEELAALLHVDERVPVLDGRECGGHVARHAVGDVPEVEVVGRADPDDRVLLRRVLRAVDVGRDADPVAHRDHHLALDDGE